MHSLYFIRHGESQDNSLNIWSRPTTPLTDTGRKQVSAAAKLIQSQGLTFDLIVVSPLPRAQESAAIICDGIGYPPDKLETMEIFTERDFGVLTGTPGTAFFDFGKTMADTDLVEGIETFAKLQARAAKALRYLKSRPEKTILLVGHGTFCRALRRVINGRPYTDEFAPNLVRFKNGEVSKLL